MNAQTNQKQAKIGGGTINIPPDYAAYRTKFMNTLENSKQCVMLTL